MGSAISTFAGGANGLMAGATANQREGATDAGNMYVTPGLVGGQSWDYNAKALQATEDMNSANMSGAAQNVQNNSILGKTYGAGGIQDQAMGQYKDLSQNGFNLNDTDKTAYGEASGNIARQFGQHDQSMSQALSDRGLSNSGAAGSAFSNSLGNKNEQLAGLQTQIAQQRMAMNQNRLAQTQNFLSSMNQQGSEAIHNNVNDQMNRAMNQYNMSTGMVKNMQNQANEQLSQRQQTAHGSTLSNALGGQAAGTAAGYGSWANGQSGKKQPDQQAMGTSSDSSIGNSAGGGDSMMSDASSMYS